MVNTESDDIQILFVIFFFFCVEIIKQLIRIDFLEHPNDATGATQPSSRLHSCLPAGAHH